MANDPKNLPPHLQTQIAGAGQSFATNEVKVENVKPQSGPPTDWQNPGNNQLPQPQVEPVQPPEPAPNDQTPSH